MFFNFLMLILACVSSSAFAGAQREYFTNPNTTIEVCHDLMGTYKIRGKYLQLISTNSDGSETHATEDKKYLVQTDGWDPKILVTSSNESFELMGEGVQNGTCR